MKKILSALMLLLFSSSASATCYHNGVAYQTGAQVGSYVCSANGSWVRK